jgi:hypothetical protein
MRIRSLEYLEKKFNEERCDICNKRHYYNTVFCQEHYSELREKNSKILEIKPIDPKLVSKWRKY